MLPITNLDFVNNPEGWGFVFKGGYNARTRKQVKRFPQQLMSAYIKKSVKNSKILGKKVCFSSLEIMILVWGIILTAEIIIKDNIT